MTDDNSNQIVPEWMRQKRAEQELAKAKAEAREQRIRAAMLLIESERPKFWRLMVEKLKIAADVLPVIHMCGGLSLIGDSQLRISVSKPGIIANMTHTDLFCDQSRIRCNCLGRSGRSDLRPNVAANSSALSHPIRKER